jgi:hypothetical protein
VNLSAQRRDASDTLSFSALQFKEFFEELEAVLQDHHTRLVHQLHSGVAPLALLMEKDVGDILSIHLAPVSIAFETPQSEDFYTSLARLMSDGKPSPHNRLHTPEKRGMSAMEKKNCQM